MIVLDLSCDRQHRFEGWFASVAEFDRQGGLGLVNCPHCGSTMIHRLPSAPYVRTGSARPAAEPSAPPPAAAPAAGADTFAKLLAELRKAAEASEDVGRGFVDEARRIHHGDAEERPIRGTASTGEMLELWEEGITALPLPPDKKDLH
ncbi:MAG: DUF1178 family protein [Zoogloea sp.]|nr:DUF1178 family protein [Zoogloea sp.]